MSDCSHESEVLLKKENGSWNQWLMRFVGNSLIISLLNWLSPVKILETGFCHGVASQIQMSGIKYGWGLTFHKTLCEKYQQFVLNYFQSHLFKNPKKSLGETNGNSLSSITESFKFLLKATRCLKAMDDVAATKTTEALNNLRGVSSSPSVYGATTLLIIMLMPVNGAISAAGAKA